MQGDSIPSKFQNWIKPIAFIVAIFIVGFSIPILLKNYLTKKTGIAPTRAPSLVEQPVEKLEGPHYRFEPNTITLSSEESAQVTVYMDTDRKGVEAFDFIATYDPEVATISSVESTPLYPSYPAIEYGEGIIAVSGNIGAAGGESFAVNDTLLIITLEGKAKGETELVIDRNKSTIAAKGQNILNDSNYVNIRVR